MTKIFLIAGARPNFVKIAAISKAFAKHKKQKPRSRFVCHIINTGQHYDYLMSKKLFQDLGIPKPYADLNVGSSSHGDQTAKIMAGFEALVLRERPNLVIVVGDVNSTMACTLVAVKLHIPVAHVESGLRSGDRAMPEEINRLVTDAIADYLFTTSKDANINLMREGVNRAKIFLTGNVMVDTLLTNLKKAGQSKIKNKLGIHGPYALLTLHRPSNVDDDGDFIEILKAIKVIQSRIPIIFPVHPRTASKLQKGKVGQMIRSFPNLLLSPPAGYLDFINLLKDASLVLTDSGGIQEETSVLGVPCLTLRDNTERPVTISSGSNILAGRKAKNIIRYALSILNRKKGLSRRKPPLWDGRSAERIVKILAHKFGF